jgi:Fe-S cluster assembly iron-binding protein IscA
MDELRENAVWIVLAALLCISVILIRAPRLSRTWKRTVVRTLGSLLLGLVTFISLLFLFFVSHDPPTQRIGFTSKSGARVALLSHAETRDSSATRVTVKGSGCCSRYVAYEYFGRGEDDVGAQSLKWLDDRHLLIQYARDDSGTQRCSSQAGDVHIVCDQQPAPSFH